MASRISLALTCMLTLRMAARDNHVDVLLLAGRGPTERVAYSLAVPFNAFAKFPGGLSIGNATITLLPDEAAAVFAFLRLAGVAV